MVTASLARKNTLGESHDVQVGPRLGGERATLWLRSILLRKLPSTGILGSQIRRIWLLSNINAQSQLQEEAHLQADLLIVQRLRQAEFFRQSNQHHKRRQ
jgi:hypothetical protein